MSRSLDLPATEGVDALAQELAKLQDNGKRRIAFLGSRHVPVVDIHLIELIARSLAEEGHNANDLAINSIKWISTTGTCLLPKKAILLFPLSWSLASS